MKMRFGKFKGQNFRDTPKWYQDWLLKQSWFKAPNPQSNYDALRNWDGYSRKGQAAYDAVFEQEKAQALTQDCLDGICTCCEGSRYYGL